MLTLAIAVAAELGVAARLFAGPWRRYPFFAFAIAAGLLQHGAALTLSPASYRSAWIWSTPLGEMVDQALSAWLDRGSSPAVGERYKLPPHRQELVEKFLAWWDGDRSTMGLAVKAAVAKLAGVPWIQPEIDAQRSPRAKK